MTVRSPETGELASLPLETVALLSLTQRLIREMKEAGVGPLQKGGNA